MSSPITKRETSVGAASPGDLEANPYSQAPDTKDDVHADVQVVDWDGPDDPENPFNWPKRTKLLMTSLVVFGTFITLINGTAITVAAADINAEFGISDASFPNSYWPVTSWTVGGAVFCLFLLPLTEDFGVRWAYLTAYAFIIIFIIPQAVAQNFATLIVVRFFAGGAIFFLSNLSVGMIADVWAGDKARTIPTNTFVTSYFVGSSIGPVIGGAILQYLHWRWILYIQLIWCGAFFPVFFFLLRETRGSVILRSRARRIRDKTGAKAYTRAELDGPPLKVILKVSIQRPMYMLCTEFVAFSMTLWSGFAVGTIYLFTQSTGQVFTELYGWQAYSTGYIQGAIVIGELLGLLVSPLQSHLYFSSASRNKETPGVPIPEARLYMSVFGGLVGMAGGMFIYAWTSYPDLPWIAPAIGLGLVGFGINVVVLGIADYLVDSYSKYASSACAALALGENMFSGFLPLAAQSMYTNMGFQWASTLLAFFALVLSMAPVLLIFKGESIRRRSPFMIEASHDRAAVVNS